LENILDIMNNHYPMTFDRIELARDMGSTSYAAFSGDEKYFLRVIKPAFFETAQSGADIQLFLQGKEFPVPPIILTKEATPYVKTDEHMLILYTFIEGENADPERDAEAIGALVGKLHHTMKSYTGELIIRSKHFYIGRYIDILQKKLYPRTNEYMIYGDSLWRKIKDLPKGYCHGDMYCGNIRKAPDATLYVHDFDTSCEGFPMYDLALACDMTNYFDYDELNYTRSNSVLVRFVPEYRRHSALKQIELDAFHSLIAVQHFCTQATVMELFGLDCFDDADIDNQLTWLYKWRGQCNQ
jgi:Ser/Thr protein kinase RdoA (MazF antagonist)